MIEGGYGLVQYHYSHTKESIHINGDKVVNKEEIKKRRTRMCWLEMELGGK